ncbi:hypothetical protein C5S53_14545 [Methanophagales archaeon]|nr:hypothetical protein C5S53_14545 [Methanophagales archaeon]
MFKAVSYPRTSIGIDRDGYSGCGGLEKSIEKSEKPVFQFLLSLNVLVPPLR